MAILKSLKIKSKEFIFTSYENDKEEKPAKIIFKRFPIPGESFTSVNKKDLFEGVDITNISKRELQAKVADNILNSFLHNLSAGNNDLKRFFDECVDSIANLEYEKSKIITVNDFWQVLPQDAAYTIAQEAFEYADKHEEFTMGNLNA